MLRASCAASACRHHRVALLQFADTEHKSGDLVGRNLDRLTSEDAAIMLLILDHIHVVDRIFQHHLQGLPHSFAAPRSQELPAFQALPDSAGDVDGSYMNYVGNLSNTDLGQPVDFVFTSGKQARMCKGEINSHVCLRGTDHRGNVGAVLQLRLEPSRNSITDFLEDAGLGVGAPHPLQRRAAAV
jgi:uncharacterized damage-inducible protein DinB